VGSLQPAILPALAARLFGSDPARRLLLLQAVWPQAVGPELARRCAPVGLQRDVLRVRVPDAAWRKVLWSMRGRVLERLRTASGPLAPERLAFVEGPGAPAPERPAAVPLPSATVLLSAAPPLPDEVGRAAGSIQDDEIRQGFVMTAARALQRRTAQES
jgi:hypothetical protein